ncbi:MAG TPA: hypothetical protein VK717_08050 [Opitutaceae bacterium]|jgi:hypothetical protein|nr:hypothetical protein [Opitutaceae bacterium]
MLLGTLNSDKKDSLAELLTQGFQEISVLSRRGKLQEARSLASALAPIMAKAEDPRLDLDCTTRAFERHHRGYPPANGRIDWRQLWSQLVLE